MAADYDKGEVTEREQKAADNQRQLGDFAAKNTTTQSKQQLGNYDFANAQNRRLADVELKQNSRKTEADRFEAMRDLQNSALGLLGSMGNQALNSSSLYNLSYMLDNRNDKDNNTYWTQHQVNQDAVNNAYDESANQNQVAKNDVVINTQKALADLEADTAANISNINPNLYVAPGSTDTVDYTLVTSDSNASDDEKTTESRTAQAVNYGASGYYDANKVPQHNAQLSGYLMPDNSVQAARDITGRNTVNGNDYFSRMLNRYNRYRR